MRQFSPLLIALLALAMLGGCAQPATNAPAADEPDQGTVIDPPVQLTDFALPSSRDGETIALSDLGGAPTLLFFGYTFCPDVCPTTLSEFKRAKELLGPEGEAAHFVFISVDGERDTPERLARYLQAFDPGFVGLQGDEATLRRIGKEYGLYYEQREVEGTSAAYLIDHSAAAYLIDGQGRLRMVYGYGTPPDVLASGVRRLMQEG